MASIPTEGPADVRVEGGLRFKAFDQAPDFTLKDYDGQDLSLSQFRGTKVLLQFYNYDETRASNRLISDYKMYEQDLKRAGIILVFVNQSTAPENFRFHYEQRVPFSLLSDENREVRQLYGVVLGPNITRNALLIDEKGEILKVWPKMSESEGGVVAKEAIALLSKLTFKEPE